MQPADGETADGSVPKRRGPKPDSKPALTRRQELNRQAQRTHRERKELYVKALEEEVSRLKELFTDAVRERDARKDERDAAHVELARLREFLMSRGIPFEHFLEEQQGATDISGATGDSQSFKANTGIVSSLGGECNASGSVLAGSDVGNARSQPNYDQIGIDFVLTLERPCFDHTQFTMAASRAAEVAPACGHALMATCPPASFVAQHPNERYPYKVPDLGTKDLIRLLNLSNSLQLGPEVTPVRAWADIASNPQLGALDEADFRAIVAELAPKIRCYGFGAVLEEFEIRDAVNAVLAPKLQSRT